MRRNGWVFLLGSVLSLLSAPVLAQQPARSIVTQPIDETSLTQLHGNVHPLAQARYDQGAVPDSFSAGRMLLLLNRPPEREAGLKQFLSEVQQRGSANYHRWVTPQEFGARFGPADADVETVADWLRSHGFSITKTSASKQFVEFSGTAGQIRGAFHTQIHRYAVQGQTHYANSSEISIPSALAQVVRGIAPLNDFRAEDYVKLGGEASYSPSARSVTPEWTAPNPFGTSNQFAFLVAPEDLATQYDLDPLYQAGVNGTGETIGIVNESNIDLSVVGSYQQLFGLPANPTQVVIDGSDPGVLGNIEVEAYLDVEVSGAVAPKSAVNLYISDGGDLYDPLEFAAIRAVEDNQASVLSVSFGNCEVTLGNAGNQFWSSLWEQAAAQGQTVFVASGDSGPYCNEIFPNSVSGIASTPWNVAVGGTDFYYSDYATGGASANTLWNQTNDGNLGSLKAPLPEQAWDDGFGLNVISDGLARNEIGAGGGGPSNCSTLSSTNICIGYPKPSWQAGPGVPADGARDIPDVALFASNGANLSGYAICVSDEECSVWSGGAADVLIVGGTSASSPLMAGIMALVDEKYGRQGQADFVLYALSQQKPSAFHDVTVGTDSVPCDQGSANCALNSASMYQTTVYSAGANYDMASGLGSVDANVVVNNWNSISFEPTTTSLQLSSTSITHGTPITATASVHSSSGAEAPTGDVAILTTSPLPSNQSQGFLTLNDGVGSGSINYFPGGYYDVTASYQGDGTFGASVSEPVGLTVRPENSTVTLSVLRGSSPVPNAGSIPYDSPLSLSIQPVGVNAPVGQTDGEATGTATFKIDATTSTVPLDAAGIASWIPPAPGVGAHTVSATYSGDASFNPSSSAPASFTVTPGFPTMNESIVAPIPGPAPNFIVPVGGSLTINVQVGPTSGIGDVINLGEVYPQGAAVPTGTVMVCLSATPNFSAACLNPTYSQTVTLASVTSAYGPYASGNATFTNLAAGYYLLSMSYSGDANWQVYNVVITNQITVAPPSNLAATTTTLSITPSSVSGMGLATITTTVTGSGNSGVAPSGVVEYFDNGASLTYTILPQNKPGSVSSISFLFSASAFASNGANQITAIYEGDANYQPSTSTAASVTASQTIGDFTLTPQSPQIAVQSGASGSVEVNLNSVNGFNGVVNLSCSSASSNVTCGVNPSAATLNGATTATVMVTSVPQTTALPGRLAIPPTFVRGAARVFALSLFLLAAATPRKRRLVALAGIGFFAALLFFAGCGGGSGTQTPPPPPPPPANGVAYSVVVTGTANGVIHNAKITVIVP